MGGRSGGIIPADCADVTTRPDGIQRFDNGGIFADNLTDAFLKESRSGYSVDTIRRRKSGSSVDSIQRFRRRLLLRRRRFRTAAGFKHVEFGFVRRFKFIRKNHRIDHNRRGGCIQRTRRKRFHLGLVTIFDHVVIRRVASGASGATDLHRVHRRGFSGSAGSAGCRFFEFEDVGARFAVFVEVGFRFESESARDAWIRTLVGVRPDVFLQDAGFGWRLLAALCLIYTAAVHVDTWTCRGYWWTLSRNLWTAG